MPSNFFSIRYDRFFDWGYGLLLLDWWQGEVTIMLLAGVLYTLMRILAFTLEVLPR